ncbi:MAG: alpha/beta fold hydrolase [Planctomycetaceae bacterium]|nr:alpha/beta fold hydrolase [Planctomycetaceae bacterium]
MRVWVGEPSTFRSFFGLRSAHLQTILGPYLPGKVLRNTVEFTVELADGDSVAVHLDPPTISHGSNSHLNSMGGRTAHAQSAANVARSLSQPEVVIVSVHGLAGCHQSRYMQRLAWYANQRGWFSYRMDMRGAGTSGVRSRYLYHAGRSDDLLDVLRFVRQQHPRGQIYLCGFSLGASVALLLLSESASLADVGLSGAVAVCPPLDLARSADELQLGLNRIYDHVFAKALWKALLARPLAVRQLGERMPPRRPKTLKSFDEQVTVPLGGFQTVEEYYTRFSTGPKVHQISLPTLVIMAQDDPLIAFEVAQNVVWSPTTKVVATERGGHLGFIGRGSGGPPWQGIRWVEQAIIQAIEQQLAQETMSR